MIYSPYIVQTCVKELSAPPDLYEHSDHFREGYLSNTSYPSNNHLQLELHPSYCNTCTHVNAFCCNTGVTLNMTITVIHVCNMKIVRLQKA